MPDHGRRRSPARLLAPLGLLLVVGACLAIITNSTNSDGGGGKQETSKKRADQRPRKGVQRRRQQRASYTVKLNDTLGLIAQKTGVPVERLQTLNPQLDPQNLVVGQKVKLRE